MMIEKEAMAGSLESNDVLITIQPNTLGIKIDLQSVVARQFGTSIKRLIRDMLSQYEIKNAYVMVNDRGAIDCTLKARMETAILRAQGGLPK